MEGMVIRELILVLAGCVVAGGIHGSPLPEPYKGPAQAAVGVVTLIAMAHSAGML